MKQVIGWIIAIIIAVNVLSQCSSGGDSLYYRVKDTGVSRSDYNAQCATNRGEFGNRVSQDFYRLTEVEQNSVRNAVRADPNCRAED